MGLTPDQVLDMNLDTFNAYVEGYGDRLFDLQLLSVHTGFWAGYYTGSKKPKSIKKIIELLVQKKFNTSNPQQYADTIDVESFQNLERRLGGIVDGR